MLRNGGHFVKDLPRVFVVAPSAGIGLLTASKFLEAFLEKDFESFSAKQTKPL
jgi:hypothetical protein